jgi:hypothetical protein
MKNKLLIPLIVASVAGLTISSSFMGLFIHKQQQQKNLAADFAELEQQFGELLADYEVLIGEKEDLQEQFDSLEEQYNSLEMNYNDLQELYYELEILVENLEAEIEGWVSSIKTLPMLDKMSYYYHLCRMNFNPFQQSYMTFGRNLILHGSRQYNGFYSDIDTVLSNYNFFDYSSSMTEAWTAVTQCLGDWMLDIGHFNYNLETIFNWVTSHITYRYDDETAYNRNYPIDLFLSALETLKYRCGDCDDYSILGGTLFEESNIDVHFATIHDDTYYPDELHHAFLWVHCNRDDWEQKAVSNPIWTFNGGDSYEWLLCDLTSGWQQSIWHEPGWLTWYDDNDISSSEWMDFVDTIPCNPPS